MIFPAVCPGAATLNQWHPVKGKAAGLVETMGSCVFGTYLLEGILRRLLDGVYLSLEPKLHVLPACLVWGGSGTLRHGGYLVPEKTAWPAKTPVAKHKLWKCGFSGKTLDKKQMFCYTDHKNSKVVGRQIFAKCPFCGKKRAKSWIPDAQRTALPSAAAGSALAAEDGLPPMKR